MVLLVAVFVDVTTINIFIDAYADIDGIIRLSATFEHFKMISTILIYLSYTYTYDNDDISININKNINCNNINNNSNNTKYDVFTTQFFLCKNQKPRRFCKIDVIP